MPWEKVLQKNFINGVRAAYVMMTWLNRKKQLGEYGYMKKNMRSYFNDIGRIYCSTYSIRFALNRLTYQVITKSLSVLNCKLKLIAEKFKSKVNTKLFVIL